MAKQNSWVGEIKCIVHRIFFRLLISNVNELNIAVFSGSLEAVFALNTENLLMLFI